MSQSRAALPFDPTGVTLEKGKGLSQQLYRAIRLRVLDGRLASGTRLPASRDLALILGVSRNSIVRAYEQLFAEGFVETRVGDGTYIGNLQNLSTYLSTGLSPGLPPDLSTISAINTGHPSSSKARNNGLIEAHLSPVTQVQQGPSRAFRVGMPAVDLFPYRVWAKLQAAFWANPDPALLGYGDPAGDPLLREWVAAYLRRSRGLNCGAEQILITSGAQQAISLCAQLLVKPGECVAVENPGYRAARQAFQASGAKLEGIPVDDEGLNCDRLASLPDCRLVYVTPAHQYPMGVTLSLTRRLALLAWAERQRGWIIEDDYDGEYRYDGPPLAPLAALDREQRVIYIGTFSKITFPALRLGYLVLPTRLVETFSSARMLAVRQSEVSSQRVMAEFMAAGHFHRHIRRMRRAALARRNVLKAGWPLDIVGLGKMPVVAAGLHVTVNVDTLDRERLFVAAARAVGVEVSPLSEYWLEDSPIPGDDRAGLVLGFACVPEARIGEAMLKLRKAWSSFGPDSFDSSEGCAANSILRAGNPS